MYLGITTVNVTPSEAAPSKVRSILSFSYAILVIYIHLQLLLIVLMYVDQSGLMSYVLSCYQFLTQLQKRATSDTLTRRTVRLTPLN